MAVEYVPMRARGPQTELDQRQNGGDTGVSERGRMRELKIPGESAH